MRTVFRALIVAGAVNPALALQASPALFAATRRSCCQSWRPPVRKVHSQIDDDDELDALDTVESWDDELAAQRAWEASQAQQGGTLDSATGVDEEAHLGLDDDDDETEAERILRQVTEKQAAFLQGQAASSEPDKRVLTSLEAVLSTMMRLNDQIQQLSKEVAELKAVVSGSPAPSPPPSPPRPSPLPTESSPSPSLPAAPSAVPAAPSSAPAAPSSPPSPPASDGWDGVVDEGAWFDDDADEVDLPDWRDVRRLKKLLEQEVEEPPEGER